MKIKILVAVFTVLMMAGSLAACGRSNEAIKVLEIRDEITPENRIYTLEQVEVYMKAVESFMEAMNTPDSVRDKRSMCRTHNEKYVKDR